jgi:hypothetical protein
MQTLFPFVCYSARVGYYAFAAAQFGCYHPESVFDHVFHEDASRYVLPPLLFNPGFLTKEFIVVNTDFAELNAPPMINYGVVYPQAILMFVITMLYSVVQPLIVIFGAVYFGVAYVVYKYKLLFGECSSSPFLWRIFSLTR